jgi:starch synthase
VRVLSVASELYPLVKTGGLADVAAALPAALCRLSIDARVLVPGYGASFEALRDEAPVLDHPDLFGAGAAQLLRGYLRGVDAPAYVLDCPGLYFRDGGPYPDASGAEHPDNHLRFAAFGWAAAQLAAGADTSFVPEVVHAHDWQAGLAPAYIHAAKLATGVVTTIHNLAYQGRFDAAVWSDLGLPEDTRGIDGVEYYGGVGFLKAGIYYANRITTVSRTYAREIQEPEAGFGMDGLLAARRRDLEGIVNGVDYGVWDPRHDAHLPRRFGIEDVVAGKARARTDLSQRLGLDAAHGAPLFGVVARLDWLKGLDLLLEASRVILARGGQLVVLGSGDPTLEAGFVALAEEHPGRVAVRIGHDEPLAHLIQAASDVILVPSRSEPCGLTQLYALRYGALPLVRSTGGLADTVVNATDNELARGRATGFVFDFGTTEALAATIDWAIDFFHGQKAAWRTMQRTAMARDFSWARAARKYIEVYRAALSDVG